MSSLTCVEVEPSSYSNAQTADAAVIWLHGLGASGHDFEPIVPELHLPSTLPIRFVFPHAPNIPVTINGGMVMPAWYDILAMGPQRSVNDEQFRTSVAAVTALIDHEIDRGIASTRIVLAGFSQGGAIAYHTALAYPQRLAGLLTLSTYLPTEPALTRRKANNNIPVFISHGQDDPMVPELMGQQARQILHDMGYQVAYQTYSMGHEVCKQQIDDVSAWLQRVLSP